MASVTISTSSGADGIAPPVNSDWDAERNASSGSTNNITFLDRLDGPNYQIGRYFMFFDLSTTNIPSGSIISAVTFIHPVVSSVQNADSDSVILTAHTASDPPVGADFNNITLNNPTILGTETFANLSTVTATNIVMNSDGVAAAQAALGGTWKICLRGNRDVSNSPPTGLNQFSWAIDDADITVTYTPPGGGALLAL